MSQFFPASRQYLAIPRGLFASDRAVACGTCDWLTSAAAKLSGAEPLRPASLRCCDDAGVWSPGEEGQRCPSQKSA